MDKLAHIHIQYCEYINNWQFDIHQWSELFHYLSLFFVLFDFVRIDLFHFSKSDFKVVILSSLNTLYSKEILFSSNGTFK